MTRSAILALLMLFAAPARADTDEPVLARDTTALRVRPAEHARFYARVTAGTELHIITERGRWLRVRHGRRVGWVTRTEVQTLPHTPIARPEHTGFSGKRRGDAMKLTITTDKVRAFDDPRTQANQVLALSKGDVVTVIGSSTNDWLLVESPSGDAGWIPRSAIEASEPTVEDAPARRTATAAPAANAARTANAAPAAVATDAPAVRRSVDAPSRFTGTLVATAGADTFQLRETEAMARATGPIGAVAAGVRMYVARELWIGVAGNAGAGSGDLIYYTPTETSKPMTLRNITIDASAEVGWGRTWWLAARGGYHVTSFSVDSDRAEPMLVGEQVRGATVGLGAAVPIGRRFALAAAVDVMPAGDHQPDDPSVAAATTVRGGWARGMLTVRLPAHLMGALAYRAGMLDAQLPDGTTRSDRSHAVSAGLGVTW